MPAMQVRGLSKTFMSKRKAAGLGGSLRALWHPEWLAVEAVRGISFEMAEGEVLRLVRPNGAGKSTTIKMLAGPITLFDNTAKLLVFTVVPAAFIGAVPAELGREFSWLTLAELLAAAGAFLGLALLVFYRGLRRYESGSAIQTQV